ncbi:MAG: hypothetical protein KJZ68_09715 [Phycisphaerales bacterium]|nr:hypothetical protein [Phycisphaerales bacterium]
MTDARTAAKLKLELRLTPGVDREDAAQEAWLAHMEGRNPARAVNTFAQRERRYRRRQRAVGGRAEVLGATEHCHAR